MINLKKKKMLFTLKLQKFSNIIFIIYSIIINVINNSIINQRLKTFKVFFYLKKKKKFFIHFKHF